MTQRRDKKNLPITSTVGLPRRLFLKQFTFGAAALAAGMPSLARALAVSFDSVEEGIELTAGDTEIRRRVMREVSSGPYSTHPALALDNSQQPWVVWCEESPEKCIVRAQAFSSEDGSDGLSQILSDENDAAWQAFQPAIAAAGAWVVAAWTEVASGGRWRIRVRFRGDDGAWRDARVVAEASGGGYVWRPVIAALNEQGSFALAWEERGAQGATMVSLTKTAPEGTDDAAQVLHVAREGHDCCRPALAVWTGADPVTALTFDEYRGGGTTTAELTFVYWNKPVADWKTVTVSDNPATNLAPAAAFAPDGKSVWVGWHTNTDGENGWDIPRWYRVASVARSGRVSRPSWPPPMMDLKKTGTDQGIEFVRLAVAGDGTLAVVGRASHRFVMQTYRGKEWSPLYRFPKDGWGGRGQHAHIQFDTDGQLWVARRDVGANILASIEGLVGEKPVAPVLVVDEKSDAEKLPALEGVTPHLEFPLIPPTVPGPRENVTEGMNVYFGDIHGHTWMSDGMGDVDEHYRRARDIFHDDFSAVTDHDNFVQRKLLRSEFEMHKAIADQFDDEGHFVTFRGQEWTTPRVGAGPHAFGHKNVYGITGETPHFDHKDPRYQDAKDLYEAMRPHDMICIPHHVGWTGVDWEAVGSDVQPLCEICSVHGVFEYAGNQPIPHRGNLKGAFVQDGLAAGRRFGFTGGSDQHGLLWQHGTCWKRNVYRAGITGILAPELTRPALFEALRKRRTFATTGVKMRLAFYVNDLTMGEEGTTSGPPKVHVDVLALEPVKWVTLVRNNEEILRYGGEGPRTRVTFTDEEIPEGRASWYYPRVELMDGNMAWASPIWVTPSTA